MQHQITLALIGHPIFNSLSPILHNAALQFAGLKGEYKLIDIEPNEFKNHWQDFLPQNLNGFNVTIPYKENFFRLIKNKSAEAKLVGAINTVRIEKDKTYTGHNTDLFGFKTSLSEFIAEQRAIPHERTALVIGAGGSASAAVTGLIEMGFKNIFIKARDDSRVLAFINNLRTNLANSDYTSYHFNLAASKDNLPEEKSLSLIINASPIGSYENTVPDWLELLLDRVDRQTLCFDLVYPKDQQKPAFTQMALRKNLPALDGLPMLIQQAKAAFNYWTGIEIPTKVFLDSVASKV